MFYMILTKGDRVRLIPIDLLNLVLLLFLVERTLDQLIEMCHFILLLQDLNKSLQCNMRHPAVNTFYSILFYSYSRSLHSADS